METTLAPIILFVYNRPWHTIQTLEALAKNDLAKESILYIYADGLKDNADEETVEKIKQTRACLKKQQWCKEVIIVERENNLGLANSIITGVTEIVNKYGTIIVLEDDIVASRGFLKFMNEALSLYADNTEVGCIHAWNYDLDISGFTETTFFLKGADCWGWATWKRGWDLFKPDGALLLSEIISKNIQFEFNRRGTYDFIDMLKAQIKGINDSWAIRWHASLFLSEKLCLQPTKTLVKNIGMDNTGVHCNATDITQHPVGFIEINKIKVEESDSFFKAFQLSSDNTKKDVTINTWQKSKKLLKILYRRFFI